MSRTLASPWWSILSIDVNAGERATALSLAAMHDPVSSMTRHCREGSERGAGADSPPDPDGDTRR